jgi:hypothetical protein
MNDSFAKLNVLNSAQLSDVNHYSRLEAKDRVIADVGTTTFQFYSIDELKHMDKWQYDQFDYVVNKHGFRFEETPAETDLAVFGCSFTFGMGLPNEMLWHNILAKEMNTSCLNFGMCGASIKSMIDVFCIVSKHIKIRRAVFLLSSLMRSQIAKKHPLNGEVDYLSAIPGHDSMLCKSYGIDSANFYKFMHEEEFYKDARNEIYLSEYVAANRGIDVYYGSYNIDTIGLLKSMSFTNGVLLPPWRTPSDLMLDFARDNMHPGPKHHKYWANEIKPFIK